MVFTFLAALALARAPSAQVGISLIDSPPPVYAFGDKVTFQVLARSQAQITAVTLFIRVGDQAQVSEVQAGFLPNPEIKAVAEWDLTLSPWPPFAPVEYRWVILDGAGGRLETDPRVFSYEDRRFDWQAATSGGVTAHWYQGDATFGQAALDVAAAAITRANGDIRAPLPWQVDIYIYASPGDAQAALKLVRHLWADGHADPALGVVIVAVAPDLSAKLNLERLEREIPHELTHILVYQATRAGYASVPSWLDEGLAVINQVHPEPDYPAVLAAASQAGQLLSLSSLCGRFPDDPEQARLAYAQSESVVRYLRDRYGSEGIFKLLSAYADGDSCDEGLERGLGVSLGALESRWLDAVISPNPWRPLAPWLLLTLLILLGPGIFLLLTFRTRPARS